jgi:hypothetical protein
MRGREEAHAEKNKGTVVEYELLDMYSLFPFTTGSGNIGLREQRIRSDFRLIFNLQGREENVKLNNRQRTQPKKNLYNEHGPL